MFILFYKNVDKLIIKSNFTEALTRLEIITVFHWELVLRYFKKPEPNGKFNRTYEIILIYIMVSSAFVQKTVQRPQN